MFSSTQKFNINGDNDQDLKKVLNFALDLSESEVKSFTIDKNGLVFYDDEDDGDKDYSFEPTTTVLVEQISQYLTNLSTEDIIRMAGKEPDNDGIVNYGWEVFRPSWYGKDKIENYESSAIFAVKPCWIIYGK